MSRTRRSEIINAAGRLFAAKGYDGTSMRDLGRDLGLLGSSLYAHIASKQDLLVEVVEQGGRLFGVAAETALGTDGDAAVKLRALVAGHLDVVLDHRDEVRTFLNEARSLDVEHRTRVVEARDNYEAAFRSVLAAGAADGSLRPDLDPAVTAILILSVLNAIERWYDAAGRLSRPQLVEEVMAFVYGGVT